MTNSEHGQYAGLTARRDCLPLALRGNRPSSATAGCSGLPARFARRGSLNQFKTDRGEACDRYGPGATSARQPLSDRYCGRSTDAMPIEFVPRPRILLRWPDRRFRGLLAAVLATACATGLPGCTSHPPAESAPITWQQRLALGRLEQAEKLLDAGDLEGARRTSEVALTEARQAAYPPAIARAQALLAALRGDVIQLKDATDMLERLG